MDLYHPTRKVKLFRQGEGGPHKLHPLWITPAIIFAPEDIFGKPFCYILLHFYWGTSE